MEDNTTNNQNRKKRGAPRGARTGNQSAGSDNGDEFYNDTGDETPIVQPVTPPVVPPVTPPVQETTVIPPTQDTQATNTGSEKITDNDISSKPFVDPLLDSPVDTKAYGKGIGAQNIPKGDIPEAKFTPPKNIVDDSAPKDVQQIPKADPIQPLNAEANVMTDAEKRAGAELTVGAFWSGYEKINQFMGAILQFPVEKRIKMHHEDKLDLNMKVKVAIDGTMVTVNEFYEQYNKDVKEIFTTDPKLRARLEEPMKREAIRLGLIMSDKQVILLGLGEDLISKLVQCVALKRAINNFTEAMVEQYSELKKTRKDDVVREERESNKIDPDTEEGQARLYEMYKIFQKMDMNEVERAKANSDLFSGETNEVPPVTPPVAPPVTPAQETTTATTTPAKSNSSNITEITVYEEERNDGSNPGVEKEL